MNDQPNLGGEPQANAPEQNTEPTPPPDGGIPPGEATTWNTARTIFLFVLGFAALLIAYGAFAFTQSFWPFGTSPERTESVDTANWKVYEDSDYRFRIRYPDSWLDASVSEQDDRGADGRRIFLFEEQPKSGGCCSGLEVVIRKQDGVIPYINNIRNTAPEDLIREETIRLGGSDIRQIAVDTHFGGNARETLIPFGVDLIILRRGDVDDALIEQIVSTFEFFSIDTEALEPTTYDLNCSGYGSSALNAWGAQYYWFGPFSSNIAPGWTVVRACYNSQTNQVVYLKQKGAVPPITNQLGIYHIAQNYYSKAPEHQVQVVFGDCRKIVDWSADERGVSSILYTCQGGDAGVSGTNTYQYFANNGLLRKIRTCTTIDTDESCEVVDEIVAQVDPYCLSTARISEIGGGDVYESSPKFSHMGDLGQMLTALECGADRYREVVGGPNAQYSFGIVLHLKTTADSIRSAITTAGFVPTEACTNLPRSDCLAWEKSGPVTIRGILFLSDFVDQIEFADCTDCG